jgi:hypothetical protein
MNSFFKKKRKKKDFLFALLSLKYGPDYLSMHYMLNITEYMLILLTLCKIGLPKIGSSRDWTSVSMQTQPPNNMVLISQYEFPGIWEKVIG